MDKELRGQILNKFKKATGTSGVRLPKGFLFSKKENTLSMVFRSSRGFGLDHNPYNMQDNSAAFEGWASALYVHYLNSKGKIRLDIRAEDMPQVSESLYTKYHHYSRFLYRALRFSQQYSWFQLSDRLRALTENFSNYLEKYTFTNNLASKPAGVKDKLENVLESRFAEDHSPLLKVLKTDRIYRQLPVGLFRDMDATENLVFTGKSSAIDLWTISGSTLIVIELKAANKMVGAVTELFYYANYAYDLFVEQDNTFHKNTGQGDRGYKELLCASLKEVCGYLLLDEESCHPLINDAVLDALNQTSNAPHITYDCLKYQADDTAIKILPQ